ncbi:YgfZ/GcvT domain-containing protein [Aliiroseovarius sp. PTFE2010]|uniref:CAF17-like 4Fe-4S cluster assembly/insertion protein YgfZ n=1 Tax=Aliiroseovarius sp. PTFE2010 TaxID=3417190 RepID=UPI003CEB73CC
MRAIFEIQGADRADFLQGLVTNDVKSGDLIYAALLTPQGKYLADFFLVRRPDDYLLDVDDSLAPGLLQRLNMYKLRADVAIAPSDLSVACGTGDAPHGALPDPRHPEMGWRLYGNTSGNDGTDWTDIRVRHCIPETGIELTPDTYILEAGFERLNGVDFKKGCYVGQEVTARMKHKTELKKGLRTVRIEGAAPVGTDIVTQDGKPAGVLYSQSGDQAIAYLRFDRATGPLRAGDAIVQP